VYPGYGGQKFIPEVMDKIRKAREYAQFIGRPDMDIEIDGGVTLENAAAIRAAGANVLVAGSAVFNAPDMAGAIATLKK
ncbi:MAG: ribulose-phosphate 3-epimerase, partial [Clostridia bacterium]|nr:ribulose-phosphate 3-epimerase [Clostridia bacterium]